MSSDVCYVDHIPSVIDQVSVTTIIIVSLIMGVLAAFYPAWRVAR